MCRTLGRGGRRAHLTGRTRIVPATADGRSGAAGLIFFPNPSGLRSITRGVGGGKGFGVCPPGHFHPPPRFEGGGGSRAFVWKNCGQSGTLAAQRAAIYRCRKELQPDSGLPILWRS